MTRLQRCDLAKRMARFYLIETHPDLFGGVAVLREWGRIGRAGRVKLDPHADAASAEQAAAKLALRKRRRGYLSAGGWPVVSGQKAGRRGIFF